MVMFTVALLGERRGIAPGDSNPSAPTACLQHDTTTVATCNITTVYRDITNGLVFAVVSYRQTT